MSKIKIKRIILPFTPEGRANLKRLSGEEFVDLASAGFLPFDLILTFFFRYPRMIAHDATNAVDTNGKPIDALADHHGYAIAVLVLSGILAVGNLIVETRKLKKAKEDSSYQFMRQQLRKNSPDAEQKTFVDTTRPAPSSTATPTIEAKIHPPGPPVDRDLSWLNAYLRDDLPRKEPELMKKYSAIRVTNEGLEFELKKETDLTVPKKDKKPGFFRKYIMNGVVNPLWGALSITSFAYWILWMSSGLITTSFDIGIVGMSSLLGFGLPALFGVAALALTAYNYYRGKKDHDKNNAAAIKEKGADEQLELATPAERLAAEGDALKLLRIAVLNKKAERLESKLREELGDSEEQKVTKERETQPYSQSLNDKISWLGAGAKKKATIAFVSTTSSTFIGVQYIAWIVTDFLAKVGHIVASLPVANVIGSLFFAMSGLHGAYKAYQTYKSVKATRAEIETETEKLKEGAVSSEQIYKEKLKKFREVEQRLMKVGGRVDDLSRQFLSPEQPRFFADATRPKADNWTKFKKGAVRVLRFVNQMMSGMFILRVLMLNTGLFLPFKALTGVLAAATLANPVALGAIVGAIFLGGIIYAGFKWYEHEQNNKTARATVLRSQYKERLNHLTEQTKLLDLATQVCKKRFLERTTSLHRDTSTTVSTSPSSNNASHSGVVLSSSYSDGSGPNLWAGSSPATTPVATIAAAPASLISAELIVPTNR